MLTPNQEKAWRFERLKMEKDGTKRGPLCQNEVPHWDAFLFLVRLFRYILMFFGVYQKGVKNALDLQVTHVEHSFPLLPVEFDGTTILQLTDLHIDGPPFLLETLVQKLKEIGTVDFCCFTGDYGLYPLREEDPNHPMVSAMGKIRRALKTKHIPLAILGNHDSAHTVPLLRDMDINVLVNQKWEVEKNQQKLRFIGTDDVHYFFGPQALECLEQKEECFTIGLIHSPELYDFAAEAGIDLYLAGHTHGGQIAPFGRPLITHLDRGRDFARGAWQYRQMKGYTSNGIGTSGIPVRYGAPPEIVIHHLKRS